MSNTRKQGQGHPVAGARAAHPKRMHEPWFNAWLARNVHPRNHEEARDAFKRGIVSQIGWLMHNLLNKKVSGAVAGFKTIAERKSFYVLMFDELKSIKEEGGRKYKVKNVLGFRTAHVRSLINKWVADGLQPATINDRLSKMRVFATLIGKDGLVPDVPQLGRIGICPSVARRTAAARVDKSWEAKLSPEEIEDVIRKVEVHDKRVALMLRLERAFGNRAKEVIMMVPAASDQGDRLTVLAGAKNGLVRDIPIDTPEKRALLDQVRAHVTDKNDSLSGKDSSLKTVMSRYYRILRKVGVTKKQLGIVSHGNRHAYAHDELAKRGAAVPVKGISADTSTPEARAAVREAREEVAKAMGHSRISVTTAYSGPITRPVTPAVPPSLESGQSVGEVTAP